MNRFRKHPRRLTFSARVTIYLLVAYLLMAVMFGGLYYMSARDATRKRVVEQISHTLDQTSNDIENLISQVESIYLNLLFDEELCNQLLSYDPAVDSQPKAKAEIQSLMNAHMLNIDDILSIHLLKDDYVFYTNNYTYTSIFNIQKSAVYDRARNSSQPFWTAYDFVQEYGHTVLQDKTLPIKHRNLLSYVGPFNGLRMDKNRLQLWPSNVEKPVVSISISVNTMNSLLNQALGLYGGQCFLLDSSGVCIAHADDTMLFQAMNSDLLASMNRSSGNFYAEYAGEKHLIHYIRLSNGWTLAMATPHSATLAETYSIIGITLRNMLIVTLLLCIVLAVIVSRSLSLPIRQLLHAIKQTGGGNFDISLPPTGDEFDEVHAAFNEMNQRIDVLIRENYESKLRERENELRALKYQTKPHFLYNALTIIRSVATKNSDTEAASMIQCLSNVLRYVLRGDQNLVTVRDEVNNVFDYFDLMRASYDDVIALETDIEPAVLNAAICKMTLQPLVENCVQHGLTNLSGGRRGIVRIYGRIDGSRILLTVSDNGTGWPENFRITDEEHSTESIGLANVSRRMKLTFGDAFSIRLYTPENGGAAAEIAFPYQFIQGSTVKL